MHTNLFNHISIVILLNAMLIISVNSSIVIKFWFIIVI